MGKPAARVGDMHMCPMVTPGTPPVPHVGGPVLPPGQPNVLIGGLPAARVGDMCTCVGPPDSIILGSFTVLIGGKPAARMGDSTAHGGTITTGCPTVLIGDAGGSGGAAAPPSGAFAGMSALPGNSPSGATSNSLSPTIDTSGSAASNVTSGSSSTASAAAANQSSTGAANVADGTSSTVSGMSSSDVAAAGADSATSSSTKIESNQAIREEYNQTVSRIPALNEQWKKESVPASERASRAHEIRHDARMKARSKMQNKDEVKMLQERDQKKYGNPNGPTLEQSLAKQKSAGCSDAMAYERVIESASRTDAGYNKLAAMRSAPSLPKGKLP